MDRFADTWCVALRKDNAWWLVPLIVGAGLAVGSFTYDDFVPDPRPTTLDRLWLIFPSYGGLLLLLGSGIAAMIVVTHRKR